MLMKSYLFVHGLWSSHRAPNAQMFFCRVPITGEKSFYLQRYLKEFKYSKKSKIGDFPEMSISAARKLAALIKADNVQGKDPIIAAAERAKEKTLGDVCEEYLTKKHDSKIRDHQSK